MKMISVREQPEYMDQMISYLQESWKEVYPAMYKDCVEHCIGAEAPLPQWYLLLKDEKTIGCAGLVTNDFISRMELYPWLVALYIEETERGNGYAKLLIDRAMKDTKSMGFPNLYLSTDHSGYYEKFGFKFIGMGYHPWDENSRIYQLEL